MRRAILFTTWYISVSRNDLLNVTTNRINSGMALLYYNSEKKKWQYL